MLISLPTWCTDEDSRTDGVCGKLRLDSLFVVLNGTPLFRIALPAVNSSAPIGDYVVVLFLKLWLVSSSPTSLSFPLIVHPLPPRIFSSPVHSADTSNKYQISKPTVCSVHPGEVLKLRCPLPATGTITWTKDGSSLGANNRTLIEQEVLQIRDATAKDSGLYTCTSVGKDTVCFIVNVTGESGTCQGRWNRDA